MVDTAFAQLSQKRACPHGTNANPKQTSHESDATDALGTGDGDAAGVGVDAVVSGGVACSPSLSLLASSRGCGASECTPIE